MIEKIKRMPKRKLIISLILLIGIILIGILIVTMAFINPNITNEAITNVNVSSCGYFKLSDKSSGIDLQNSFPMTDNKGMQTDPYIFTLENSCEENKGFNLYLVVTSESTIPEENIKINLSTVDGNRTINSLGLVDLTPTIENQYDLEVGKEIRAVYLLQSATLVPDLPVTFDLRMWLDDSAGNDVQNGKFEATIMVADGVTSSDNILYPELSDICLEEEISTCYAEYSFLDDTLIRHTEELEYSAGDNNYRFSGANPDNYVNFNNELWRIIGIYDESGSQSLKLIREESIGNYKFDSDSFSTSDNRWEGANASDPSDDADLNKYLNSTYYESMSPSATSMIRDVYYNVGSVRYDHYTITGKQSHDDATSLKTTHTYNVGLIQVDDFYYSNNSEYWNLSNVDAGPHFLNESWMKEFINNSELYIMFSINPTVRELYHIMTPNSSGTFGINGSYIDYGVRPVVYLESDLILASGSGTQSDPLEFKHPETLADVCTGENMAECFAGNSHLDSALLQHTAELENSAGDDNYRYSGGKDVVNNYVCFGSDVTPCPKENKYRIIGIYDGSVKLIKATAVDKDGDGILEITSGGQDTFQYDAGNSNDYETSDIKSYLNGEFYNSIPTSYQLMIKESTWNVGGNDTYGETAYEFYRDNIASPVVNKISTGKIGLMYVSDYGYAALTNAWITDLHDYDNKTIRDNNWMFNLNSNEYEWTIVPNTSYSYNLWYVNSSGYVYSYSANIGSASRPSFYLESDVYLTGGTGTSSDPYMIGRSVKLNELILMNNNGKESIESYAEPDFTEISMKDEGMFATVDNYGTSYYFRGAVNDNWVEFAGMYWRIIRINGNGTVRLVYSGTMQPDETQAVTMLTGTDIGTSAFNSTYNSAEYTGYMYTIGQQRGLTTESTAKQTIDTWYEDNLLGTEYEEILSDTLFCGDRTVYADTSGTSAAPGTGTGGSPQYFGSYVRYIYIKKPSLECPNILDAYTVEDEVNGNGSLVYPVAMISMDEVAMAGARQNYFNYNYYLYTKSSYWALSPYYYTDSSAAEFIVSDNGVLGGSNVNNTYGLRPVVSLNSNILATGSGTWNDPYIVN